VVTSGQPAEFRAHRDGTTIAKDATMSADPKVDLTQFQSLIVVAFTAFLLAGCNALTGADDYVINYGDDTAATEGSGADGSGASGQGANGQGASGQGGNGQGGNGQGAGDPLENSGPVDGVTINSIVLYQSVERPLMENGGAASSAAPVVADREGLLRVFYSADGGYNGQPVTARFLVDGEDALQVQATLGGSSQAGDLDSTININIPPGYLGVGSAYRLDIVQALELTTGNNVAATYPTTPGTMEATGARQAGTLTVTLVPVRYDADGSGRLPDTSAAQLKRYEDLFYAMYPITDIDIQVRSQVLPWNSTISSNGNGWSNLLDSIASLRNSDNAAFNNYYYGIFEPSSSVSNFCGGGCVAGLGFLGGPGDDWSHAAIGLGFTGDMSAETAVHELGHNHGRGHAPCGNVSGADGSFRYSGGAIGSWGYNMVSGELYDPNVVKDMMGYCDPTWISDYNFANIFDRIQTVNSAANIFTPEHLRNLTYGQARVEPDGSMTWLNDVVLERPPLGELTAVSVDTAAGTEQTSASFIRYDHIEGGVLLIPPTTAQPSPGGRFSAHIDGFQLQAIIP
jgi:hypothetical protein